MSPSLRARHPQMLLALLAERHPAAHDKAMKTLTCAARITAALPVEWIPVEMDIEVIEVVAKQLAPSQMAALISDRQRQEMGSALFKTFVLMAQKLFGLTPPTMLRQLDRGWHQVFSDCGKLDVVSIEDRSGTVMLRNLPEVCLASKEWIGALPSGMRVLFELIGATGNVTASLRGAEVELRFTW